MNTLYLILTIIALHNIVLAEFDEMIRALKTFIVRRHVQTVTAADTCWSFETERKLFEVLSSIDISVSFWPVSSVQRSQVTWYRCAFLVDLSCKNAINNFQQVSNDREFNTQNDWILFNQNPLVNNANTSLIASQTFEIYFGNAYVLPDSGVFLFQQIDDNVWEIWSGFRASKLDTIRVFKIGMVSSNYFYSMNVLNNERSDFRGITLKSATVIIDSEKFFGFHTKVSSGLDVFAHMHYELIYTLSYQLNFKIDLSIDNDYGWSLGNGSFGGVTGLLQREEIDFSATGIFIRPDRMKVIDFTVGIVVLRTTALFRQPSLSSVHNILLLPFKLEVWLVGLVIFIVFILVFLIRMNNHFMKNDKSPLNIPDIITLVHGAICQQGSSFNSHFVSIRLVVFILFFTTLYAFTLYSANIVTLIQSHSNSIKSIKDIVESPMTFNAQISPYGKRYFEETNDPVLKKLYNRKIMRNENQAFVKTSSGVEKIRTEFHGFSVEVMAAYKIINNEWLEEEKCGLAEIELFKMPLLAIALVKKSGHKDIFKQKLIQQMEIGLDKRIANQWTAPKPSCESFGKQYVSVSIKDIHLTLKIFGYGVCVSVVIFTLEVAFHTWTSRQINSRQKQFKTPEIFVQTHM